MTLQTESTKPSTQALSEMLISLLPIRNLLILKTILILQILHVTFYLVPGIIQLGLCKEESYPCHLLCLCSKSFNMKNLNVFLLAWP
jgi:hypothetical protein